VGRSELQRLVSGMAFSKTYWESGEIGLIDTYKKGCKINSKKYDELGRIIC